MSMIKRLIRLTMAAVLLISFCCFLIIASAATVSKGTAFEDKWLSLSTNKTGARYFVDKAGKPVRLFGMARCQQHRSEEDLLFSTLANTDVLTRHYTDLNCNFMRLAIDFAELEKSGDYSQENISKFITNAVDPDVQSIIRAGMYVMLDVHMYPPAGTAQAVVKHARDRYIPFLVELAKKYADEPMIAVIELWNEPYPADQEVLQHDQVEWNRLVREFFIDGVNEIRKYDKKHVLMVSDFNAGWGSALTTTWNGYYDQLDPVYRNTCHSIHVSYQQLDEAYDFNHYNNWFRNTAKNNNLCLMFGEIETEGNLMTTNGMENLMKMFNETKNEFQFGGVLWRPHSDESNYVSLWKNWAKSYATPAPSPVSRFVIEAENFAGDQSKAGSLVRQSLLFGAPAVGTGISLNANLPENRFFEGSRSENLIYPAGTYQLTAVTCGDASNSAGFIVGYRTVSGKVYQIAALEGSSAAGQLNNQTVSFTSKEQIVSVVFFGRDKQKKSVSIDRVYLTGKDGQKSVRAGNVTVSNISQIITLAGKTLTPEKTAAVESQDGNKSTVTSDKTKKASSGAGSELPAESGDENEDTDSENNDNESSTASGAKANKDVSSVKTKSGTSKALTVAMIIMLGFVVAIFGAVFVLTLLKKAKARNNDITAP